MGKEADANIWVGSRAARARVLLETDEIIFRGPIAQRFRFNGITNLRESAGRLEFESDGQTIAIELGARAKVWLSTIQNPRTRVQKLGLIQGTRVCVLGPAEADALQEISVVLDKAPSRRLVNEAQLVLLFAPEPDDLSKLPAIAERLAANGAVWVLWPKGRKDFTHDDVVAAAKTAGLVQTKSMGFSAVYTGLRLTRPARATSSKG